MLGARTGGLSCPLCSGLDCRTAAGPALDFWLGEQAQGTLRHPASAGGRGGWRVVAGETRLGVAGSAVGDSAGTWSFAVGSVDVPGGTPPGLVGLRTHRPGKRDIARSRRLAFAGDRGRWRGIVGWRAPLCLLGTRPARCPSLDNGGFHDSMTSGLYRSALPAVLELDSDNLASYFCGGAVKGFSPRP